MKCDKGSDSKATGEAVSKTFIWASLAVAWLIVVFFFTAMPGTKSNMLSLWVSNHIMKWLLRFGIARRNLNYIVRKIAHLCAFAIEGSLIYGTFRTLLMGKWTWIVSMTLSIVFAISTEWGQIYSQGRSCEVRDMLIDLGGAVVGILLCAGIQALRRQRRVDQCSG